MVYFFVWCSSSWNVKWEVVKNKEETVKKVVYNIVKNPFC